MQRLSKLHIGSALDEETDMGPMVHERHRDHIESAIDNYRNMGATIHQAGELPDLSGWFVAPTLVTGVAMDDALDEVFGPVATVHAYRDNDEAVSLGNGAPYGLSAYVFGEAGAAYEVARQVEAGTVKINSVTLLSPHPDAPRPAWRLSGLGEEGTRETFEFFRGSRVIGMPEGLPD